MIAKKYIIESFKDDILIQKEYEIQSVEDNEVIIKNSAIGINFIDLYLRAGFIKSEESLPSDIGVESVGVIVKVGKGVKGFNVGDRVAYIGGEPKTYASFFKCEIARLIKLPDFISDKYASAVMFKGLTVNYLINSCFQVRKGQTVLWHAAAGGVGQIATQWLKSKGAKVIGTVSSSEKSEVAYKNGCDEVIITSLMDFEKEVMNITNDLGVDVVYDSVGKDTFERSLKCLKKRGTLVLFGNSSGKIESFDVSKLGAYGSLFLTRPSISHYLSSSEEIKFNADLLFLAIKENLFNLNDISEYKFSEIPKAHSRLKNRTSTGSTIITF